MSVVGFDLGNQNCFISVARQGGIEVVTNDYSLHATPSCVQFGARSRIVGVAASQQKMTNLKNTIMNFKNLIGRKYSDPVVQNELRWASPCEIVQLPNDNLGIRVDFLGEKRNLTPEQVTAILLLKLKETAEAYLKTKVFDCVVSVPCFWTDAQRRALLDSTKIADLNCLRILNETTAIALAYGIYKQDLPPETEKPRHVVFLDVGHSATQASLVAFNKGKLKVLGTSWDMSVGGRNFDGNLRDHFRQEFLQKYKVDGGSRPRPWCRLLDECEKLKKLMSANSTKIPINIECFMEDKDVTAHMKRSDFNEMCESFWAKIENLLRRLLTETKFSPADVDCIELLGGGSRMCRVRDIVKSIFGKDPNTTLNQDEAVSRGCALQCAMLSPTFRVREFSVTDAQPFSIKLKWPDDGEAIVFEQNHQFPFSKMITLYRKEPFVLDASYHLPNQIPYPSIGIGQFRVNDVAPSADNEAQKIKVKVRLNSNGIFCVASASMYEKAKGGNAEEQAESAGIANESMEVENGAPQKDKNDANIPNGPATQEFEQEEKMVGQQESEQKEAPAPGTEEGKQEQQQQQQQSAPPKPAKPKIKSIDLAVDELVPQLSTQELEKFRNMEAEMRNQDRMEKEKGFAKNSLEEYSYEMRDKLIDSLQPFVTEKDAEEFKRLLQEIEDWIYDEGDDQPKKVYDSKLAELKKLGDPIVERYQEAQGRPDAFNQLARSLQRTRKAYEAYLAGDELYSHIEAGDMDRVRKILEEKQAWFDKNMNSQQRRPLTEPPVVLASQILQEKDALEVVVRPILNKPKPKVEPPSEEKPKENGEQEVPQPPPPSKGEGDANNSDAMEVD